MITTKLFSKNRASGMFGAALRGQLGFMIFAFIFLFITIVVPFMVSAPDHRNFIAVRSLVLPDNSQAIANFYQTAFSGGIYLGGAGHAITVAVILSILAFACALSSSRYMHSMKMTDLYHSLPIRREKLLLTNLAASMIAVIGPLLVLTIVTMLGILITYGGYGWVGPWFFGVIAADFLTILIAVFVMYAFTTLIAVQVGTTFDALALTCMLGFLPTTVYLIGGAVWQSAIYGAVFDGGLFLRLSPFLFFFERIAFRNPLTFAISPWGGYGLIVAIFIVWALIGVVFFAGAILLYKRRKSELAGTTQPQGRLQMIAKFFAAFCGGAIFLAIFNHNTLFGRIIAIALATVAFGLIAELILSRGIRSIPRNAKWLAIAGAVCSLLYLGIAIDVLGHSTRVPDTARIASVSISYRGRFADEDSPGRFYPELWRNFQGSIPLTSPESIAIVREVHQNTVDDFVENGGRIFNNSSMRWGGNHLAVQYQLTNGRTFIRRYHSVSDESLRMLASLEDKDDFIAANSPLFFMEEHISRSPRPIHIGVEVAPVTGGISGTTTLLTTNAPEEVQILISAMQEDMLRETLDEIKNPVMPVLGYIRLVYLDPLGSGRGVRVTHNMALDFDLSVVAALPDYRNPAAETWAAVLETLIPITQGYTNTLAALRSLGLIELLQPDYQRVFEIRMTDFMDSNVTNAAMVIGLTPQRGWHRSFDWRIRDRLESRRWDYDNDSSADGVFILTDPDDIAHVIGRGHSTLMSDKNNARRTLLMQFYGEYGEFLASQFILVSDLPESIRVEAAAHLELRERQFSEAAFYSQQPFPITSQIEQSVIVAHAG